MAIGMSNFAGPIVVCASLLMCQKTLVTEYPNRGGVPILLPHPCARDGGRTDQGGAATVVRYRMDHSSFVNHQLAPVKDDLLRQVRGREGWRNVQVIFFTADARLGYREVSTVLADLQKDSPELHVFLMTEKQVGPVEEMQWNRVNDLC
jgi:biopolymer transport protein ExbD